MGKYIKLLFLTGAMVLSALVSSAVLAGGDETPAGVGAGISEGKWRFLTTGDYEGYVHGTLKVGQDESGAQTCKLIVYQSEFGSAVERCSISREGDTIIITAEEVVTSSVPSWRKEVFRLRPGENEMTGVVLIVVDFPVHFARKS